MEATAAERYASGGPATGSARAEPRARVRGDRRAARRRPGDHHRGGRRRGLDHLERAPRPGRADRRRAGEARRRQGRHRRDDAQQPARVHRARHGRGLARRGPVLDLPDLLARADPVRGLRRGREGGDRRERVPRGLRQGARGASRSSRPWSSIDGDGGDHTLAELEAARPGLRHHRDRSRRSGRTTC